MERITKRIDINIGYRCNSSCKFCYYHPFLENSFFDKNDIKKQIKAAKRLGIKDIDITGGEPTLCNDLVEIIEYIRDNNFRRICLISNGTVLSNLDFLKKVKDAGVNEILFSLHGHNEASHDMLTGNRGSFKKCLSAIENAHSEGVRVKTNSVITSYNYKIIPEVAELLVKLSPEFSSLINLNPCASKEIYKKDIVPRLIDTVPYSKKALDILNGHVNAKIMYIPFCLMKGYEEYVINMKQIQYDNNEWNYFLKNVVLSGFFRTLVFCIKTYMKKLNFESSILSMPSEFLYNTYISVLCKKNNVKVECCYCCKYRAICDGLWIDYKKIYGCSEIFCVPGKKINDPAFYIRKT